MKGNVEGLADSFNKIIQARPDLTVRNECDEVVARRDKFLIDIDDGMRLANSLWSFDHQSLRTRCFETCIDASCNFIRDGWAIKNSALDGFFEARRS